MEHKDELLDSLAELRAAHDKASRLMAEIATVGARALKVGTSPPSLLQLQRYAQALAQLQGLVTQCEGLVVGGAAARNPAPAPAAHGRLH